MHEQFPNFPYHAYYPYYPVTSPNFYSPYTEQRQENEGDMLPMEQSYIENILRLNRGKHVKVYMTIEHETKRFDGVIEAAGRDHIILNDPETGKRYLLLMVYLDYVVFDEEINYEYPYANAANPLSQYSPR